MTTYFYQVAMLDLPYDLEDLNDTLKRNDVKYAYTYMFEDDGLIGFEIMCNKRLEGILEDFTISYHSQIDYDLFDLGLYTTDHRFIADTE